jgi:hypothetical protein
VLFLDARIAPPGVAGVFVFPAVRGFADQMVWIGKSPTPINKPQVADSRGHGDAAMRWIVYTLRAIKSAAHAASSVDNCGSGGSV